ncbi:low voltage-gated calcium channel [Aureococcus anophagefferens]|nr:low voltage-gated calcium channel [Aureococcus anophagefferens]
MKKLKEQEGDEEDENEVPTTEVMNEDIATNPAGVLRAHELKVFGDDEEDHHLAQDYGTTSRRPRATAAADEGLFSFPMPHCLRCVCYAHVQLVRDDRFDLIVNVTIGLVAVAFTLHLMDKPDLAKPSTTSLQMFVTFVRYMSLFVFTGEMVVKILAEGTRPLRYWLGPESSINTFDSSIVILSFALMGGGGGEAILPVLRLARLVKLLNRTAQTRRVLYGIIAGFRAMVSIMVLLTLIIFLYAIIGVKSFGENDPAHFGTLPVAMLTLFVAVTLSDWSHMYQINYKGCDKGGEDWGYERTDELTRFSTAVGRFYYYDCYDPTPRKLDAILFFYSFTLLTAFVVLNLFISAIDMAMFDILYSDQVEEHAENVEKDDGHAPSDVAKSNRLSFADPLAAVPGTAVPGKRTSVLANAGLLPETPEAREKRKSVTAQKRASNAMSLALPNIRTSQVIGSIGLGAFVDSSMKEATTGEELATQLFSGPERSTFDEALELFFEPKVHKIEKSVEEDQGTAVRIARYICQGNVFPSLVVVCILIAGLVEALSIDPDEPVKDEILILIDTVVLCVFIFECVLKIVACGKAPYRYFADNWNVFDFCIVLVSVIGMIPGADDKMPGVAMLRLLRLLKLVNVYPALNVAVCSLIKASSNVFYAILVFVLFIYVYAVVGMMLFRVNDPGHYGTFAQAIAAVWAVCTQDGWDCHNSRSFGWIAALYFCSLILIGAWMMPTVIIGITTIAFAESTDEIKEEYAQLKMALEVAESAAKLFDSDIIPKEIIYPFNSMYSRMAEEQVKAKMLEFNIDTTKQSESNTGLRVFMMRPFMKYICANYVTGLLPPNRSKLSDDACNEIFEAACGTVLKEARCTWPCFLFLLNFMKCSAPYGPPPAEGVEEEDEEDTREKEKKQEKKTKAKKGGLLGATKGLFNKMRLQDIDEEDEEDEEDDESKTAEYGMEMVSGAADAALHVADDLHVADAADAALDFIHEHPDEAGAKNPDHNQISCGHLTPGSEFTGFSFFNYNNSSDEAKDPPSEPDAAGEER